MSELEKAKKRLKLKKLVFSKEEQEVRIMEFQEKIENIHREIQLQEEAIEELTKELKDL